MTSCQRGTDEVGEEGKMGGRSIVSVRDEEVDVGWVVSAGGGGNEQRMSFIFFTK